ncbi:unnamed protein product, partial [marine sediment metagenome]
DQLMNIREAFKGNNLILVTNQSEIKGRLIDIQKIYYVKNPPKPIGFGLDIFSLIFNCIRIILPCIKILYKEKPDIIIGCGGEPTLIMSYLGKLTGVRVIFIESLTRIHDLSPCGKLVIYITDLFLVQWKGLAHKYKKASYWGKVV